MNTAAFVLFLVAFLPYVWAIISGSADPSPISWGIWASVDTLALLAMRKKQAPIGQISGAVIGASIVTILALIYGTPTMGSIEWVSVIGAVVGIVLWQVSGNATLAIISSQIATFIGAFPTFAHGYNNPAKEDPVAWTIWLVSCVCALLAVRKWNLEEALQPLNFTAIEAIMVTLVVIIPHWPW